MDFARISMEYDKELRIEKCLYIFLDNFSGISKLLIVGDEAVFLFEINIYLEMNN